MKKTILFFALFCLVFGLKAQILTESEALGSLCNSNIDDTNFPDESGCVQEVTNTITTINGQFGNDDGNDYYAIKLGSNGTVTFTYSISPVVAAILTISEYSGTIRFCWSYYRHDNNACFGWVIYF